MTTKDLNFNYCLILLCLNSIIRLAVLGRHINIALARAISHESGEEPNERVCFSQNYCHQQNIFMFLYFCSMTRGLK